MAPEGGGLLTGLHRSEDDYVLVGVCGGLAERFRVRAFYVRLGFIVAGLASGIGVVLYALMAFTMPAADEAGGPVWERVKRRAVGVFAQGWLALKQIPGLYARWQEMRTDETSRRRLRAVAAAVALGLGLYLFIGSFGLFDWLTGGRLFALVLCFIGLAMFAGWKSD